MSKEQWWAVALGLASILNTIGLMQLGKRISEIERRLNSMR